MAQKELERTKQKLESAETTKARALRDLERAKRTTEELTAKLKAVNESKESTIQAAEYVKEKAKQLEFTKSQKSMGGEVNRNQELDHARAHYISTATEIDVVKQELNKIRQDFDATLEAKQAAFQQAAEARCLAKVSTERVGELQKEISAMKEGIKQIKFATQQANEEQGKAASGKDHLVQCYKDAKEAADKKLNSLKKEYDPELCSSLEKQVAETTADIETLQKQMKLAHAAEMETMRAVTIELNEATKILQEVADEECSLRNLVSSLELEVEEVKKECEELKEKAAEKEAEKEAKEIEVMERKAAEKEAAEMVTIAEEKEAEEHRLKLEQLLSETESARKEAEEMTKITEELKQEAETAQMDAEEAEKNAQLALSDVEEAKASEKKTRDELDILSMKSDSASAPTKITIAKEEFESLNKKVEESEDLAEKKLAEALAQLEVINASKNEADRKLEENLKAMEEIKEATEMALKSAETAAAAQSMVEGELRRWRQQEQQMTAA